MTYEELCDAARCTNCRGRGWTMDPPERGSAYVGGIPMNPHACLQCHGTGINPRFSFRVDTQSDD